MKLVSPTYGNFDFHPKGLFLVSSLHAFLPSPISLPLNQSQWQTLSSSSNPSFETNFSNVTSSFRSPNQMPLSQPSCSWSLFSPRHSKPHHLLRTPLALACKRLHRHNFPLRTHLSLSLVLLPPSSAELDRILCPFSCLPTCFPITSPSFKHSGYLKFVMLVITCTPKLASLTR